MSTETTQETRTGEAAVEAAPMLITGMPQAVADYGPVRLELMGHRLRVGCLSEVVIAGQPFLRLDLEGGTVELYRPDAVYCITPGVALPPVPRAEIPARFGYAMEDDDDTWEGDDE